MMIRTIQAAALGAAFTLLCGALVATAPALAQDAPVIVMDEPCSALDPIATARIEALIDELRENYTIAIVTHSMQQAARVSQRTACCIEWVTMAMV